MNEMMEEVDCKDRVMHNQ